MPAGRNTVYWGPGRLLKKFEKNFASNKRLCKTDISTKTKKNELHRRGKSMKQKLLEMVHVTVSKKLFWWNLKNEGGRAKKFLTLFVQLGNLFYSFPPPMNVIFFGLKADIGFTKELVWDAKYFSIWFKLLYSQPGPQLAISCIIWECLFCLMYIQNIIFHLRL